MEKHGEALLHAKRIVAERCIYGVDKNAAAVELAKLSMWLETMSAEKSFTFLDHTLRHGDSLVGLDIEQIRAFHWVPEKQLPTVALLLDQQLAEVREQREAIQALAADESEAAQGEKRRLLEYAEVAMRRVKLVADACVGAFFAAEKPKAREAERVKRLAVVEAWLAGNEEMGAKVEEWSREIRERHAPFHWHVELPEVFFLERPDPLDGGKVNGAAFVDAFVGSPPFLGGRRIRAELGDAYTEWLGSSQRGSLNADLSARFFRRAASRVGSHGAIGFIATNTIAQGDYRETGLDFLLREKKFVIFDAIESLSWPGDAAVMVSVVCMAVGKPAHKTGAKRLGDVVVPFINSFLEAAIERPKPVALASNASSSFQGCVLAPNDGFVLTPAERADLLGPPEE